MASDICNRLEKLIPPPFVTVETTSSRAILLLRKKLLRSSNYHRDAELMSVEMDFLSGYILRKGQQLRLEKALRLTNQVQKLGQRWKGNGLIQHLNQFEAVFAIKKIGSLARPPSKQWATWIVYLVLRDAALLAKIKLECEHAVEYWLGLIAMAHHWGDSLVITGILSRIWHLSSNMVHEMINRTYPIYIDLCRLLEPTKSSTWPDENWKFPEDLYMWLRDAMKLSFETARLNVSLSYFKRNTSAAGNEIFSLLSKSYDTNSEQIEVDTKTVSVELEEMGPLHSPLDDKFFFLDTQGTGNVNFLEDSSTLEVQDEDFGVVLNREDTELPLSERSERPKKKKRKKKKPSKDIEVEHTNEPPSKKSRLSKRKRKRRS